MRTRSRTRPASALPALHTFQLGVWSQLDYAVDLAVRMLMVLARILLLGLHVDGGDAEEASVGVG